MDSRPHDVLAPLLVYPVWLEFGPFCLNSGFTENAGYKGLFPLATHSNSHYAGKVRNVYASWVFCMLGFRVTARVSVLARIFSLFVAEKELSGS